MVRTSRHCHQDGSAYALVPTVHFYCFGKQYAPNHVRLYMENIVPLLYYWPYWYGVIGRHPPGILHTDQKQRTRVTLLPQGQICVKSLDKEVHQHLHRCLKVLKWFTYMQQTNLRGQLPNQHPTSIPSLARGFHQDCPGEPPIVSSQPTAPRQ
jgi:hypothetical protein